MVIRVVDQIWPVRCSSDECIVAGKRNIQRGSRFERADARQLPVTEHLTKKAPARKERNIVHITHDQDVCTVEVAACMLQLPVVSILMSIAGYVAARVIQRMGPGIRGLQRQAMISLSSNAGLQ